MKPWVIGNWKLNPAALSEVNKLIDGISANISTEQACHLMIAPSFLHLSAALACIEKNNANIYLASQDVSEHTPESGAFTGDVSAAQLKNMGVEWVIIGHSERRQYYLESNDALLQKILNSHSQQLGVVFCIGESEADYDAGKTEAVLAEQLTVIEKLLAELDAGQRNTLTDKLIVAYEPVWAIGTGKVPSVEEVFSVHEFIRQQLQTFNEQLVDTPLLYGGSVKPDNAAEFAACSEVNGVLVGGAALDAQSFIDIATCFNP